MTKANESSMSNSAKAAAFSMSASSRFPYKNNQAQYIMYILNIYKYIANS